MKRKEIRCNLNGPKTKAFFDGTSRGMTVAYIEFREGKKIARAWIDVSRFYSGKPPVLCVTVRKTDGQDKTTDHPIPWRTEA